MTPADLNTLARDIAEAAAKCMGAEPAQAGASIRRHIAGESAVVACSAWAGEWSAWASSPAGRNGAAALNCAAVLALRDRVVAQREERARMLAADDAALRVIDETARVYDAATVAEAARGLAPDEVGGDRASASVLRVLRVFDDGADAAPWTGAAIDRAANCLVLDGKPIALRDACDAILRRRAGTP